VIDFLLVLIELFLPALTVEVIGADIGRKMRNCGVQKGWVTSSTNSEGRGGRLHKRLLASEK